MDVYELIVGFDVESEEFRVLSAPPDYRRGQAYVHFRLHLTVLGGQLCLLDSTPDDHIVIWVMKEYGVEGSWKKEYVVEPPLIGLERPYVSPLCLMKNEEILFSCNGRTLIQYDLVEKRFRAVRIQGLPPYFSAFNHVGSLVSLRDAGETMSGWRGSGSYGRWSTTLRPVPSHDPKISMELLFSHQGLYQVADPDQPGMIMFLPRDGR
ncbi:hypothetical protein L1049_000816 [Liquidambar formosana]|uniref:F-box associated beta-propeller type 3 domain-containing protein n=1 Tax=Liquidambar formosana TaxID=63359 RepID=A0AAP0NAE6_LIQFO